MTEVIQNKITGRSTTGVIAGVIFAFFLFAWGVPCPAVAAESPTLSVRTDDGLIVLAGDREAVMSIAEMISKQLSPPYTNSAVMGFVRKQSGVGSIVRATPYFSAAGEKKSRRMRTTETTVGKAVDEGRIPSIVNRPMYEAYTLFRAAGDDVFIASSAVENETFSLDRTVFLFSGLGAPPVGLFIDGRRGGAVTAGITAAAFGADNRTLIGVKNFETFATPKSASDLESFFDSLAPGSSVAVSTIGGVGVFSTGGMFRALRDYGMTAAPDPEVPMSIALLGRKSSPLLARNADGIYRDVSLIHFANNIRLSPDEVKAMESRAQSRSVVLYGTRSTDPLVIVEPED